MKKFGNVLLAAVPELASTKCIPMEGFSHRCGSDGGTEEVVNWMAAIDYFHCRNAHSVPLQSEVRFL